MPTEPETPAPDAPADAPKPTGEATAAEAGPGAAEVAELPADALEPLQE